MTIVERVRCPLCAEHNLKSDHLSLTSHLKRRHSLAIPEFQTNHPDSPIFTNEIWKAWQKEASQIVRKGTERYPKRIKVGQVSIEIEPGEVFSKFSRPHAYKYPTEGKLQGSVERLARSIKYGRSCYIYGPAGCGKSAAVRALCHDINRESSHYPMREGLDTELYLGKEAVVIDPETKQSITQYQKGMLLRDLEGRIGKDGVRRGVVLLIDDIDRAPAEYHEVFRHVLEDNAHNVFVPELGVNIDIHPDTLIIATANSAGRGDMQGFYTSVQEMDESILDRFQRVVEFTFMPEKAEIEILKNKYPELTELMGDKGLSAIMKTAASIRSLIEDREIYATFSHRRIVQWMDSIQELVQENDHQYESSMLSKGAKDWLDRFNEETRQSVLDRAVGVFCGS